MALLILALALPESAIRAVAEQSDQAGYTPKIIEARCLVDFRTALEKGPDLVIGDPSPEFATAADLVRMAARSEAPFVALAPGLTHDEGLDAMRQGAFDYLTEEDLGRLPALILRSQGHRNEQRIVRRAVRDRNRFEAYFRQLLRNAAEAVVLLDDKERVLDLNPAFEAMFGYTLAEAAGRSLRDLIVPKDLTDEYLTVAAQIYRGKIARIETTRKRKDGSHVRVSGIGVPFELEDGKLGANVIYSDITSRMRALDALRQAESNYRDFFHNAVEGMYISTPLGRFVIANQALADLLGFETPSQVTDTVRSISREIYGDPDHRQRFQDIIKEQDSDCVRGFHSTVRRRDGQLVEVLENVRAIYDEDGDLLYYQGTMSAVS